MQCQPHKRRGSFFANPASRKPITKSALPLPVKQILPEEKTEQIIHAKSIIRNKIDPNSKFKLLFETLVKPLNRNPFIFSHLHRKDTLDRAHKQDLTHVSKINELIFRTEVQALARNIDSQKPVPSKSMKETRLGFTQLRRSFRISEHCKSSLLSLNRDTRLKTEPQHSSISYSQVTKKKARPLPITRNFSFRTSLRPKEKTVERSVGKVEDIIKGWQDLQGREMIPTSPIDFSNQY